jgi:glycosyltransferase involved in cell wall biosynthesis
LLKNLRERYFGDIAEIIVLDNLSTDSSKEIAEQYGARFVTIENFSFGGSANVVLEKLDFL